MINKNSSSCNRAISFESLFTHIGVRSLLARAKFSKRSGADVFTLISVVVTSIFKGYPNLYRFFESTEGKSLPFSKDSVYRFLSNPKYDWQSLMFYIATFIIRFICELNKNNKNQVNCLIVDDTMIERCRGKKVELLSRQYNHVIGKTVKGFINLALGWTDGINYVPLLSHLIASNKEKNLIQKANTSNIDNRTTGAKRRVLACKKKPEVLISMCRRAMRAIPASHILMDSWFFSDFLVRELKKLGLQSICLVKSNLQFKLEKGSSKSFSQKELLKKINGGKLNMAKLITSVIAYTNKDLKIRLVFVKARNSTDWICIVSTDIDLSPERIIELYGRRWSIEVAFKAQKSYLGLKSECQDHDFDTCNAFMVIANIRLQLMEFNRRHDNDPRSIGELFYSARSELTAITFAEALQTLLLLIDNIAVTLDAAGCICKGKLAKAKEVISNAISEWFSGITDYIKMYIQLPQTSL